MRLEDTIGRSKTDRTRPKAQLWVKMNSSNLKRKKRTYFSNLSLLFKTEVGRQNKTKKNSGWWYPLEAKEVLCFGCCWLNMIPAECVPCLYLFCCCCSLLLLLPPVYSFTVCCCCRVERSSASAPRLVSTLYLQHQYLFSSFFFLPLCQASSHPS